MLALGGTSGQFGVGEGGSVICFVFTLYALHLCMAFVSELQFCMTRALVDDAFLLLPFALLPFCPFALLPNCFRFLFCCVLRLLCMDCIFVWWACMMRALVDDDLLLLPLARLSNCFRFLFCCPFALLPNCFVFYFVLFSVYFVCIVFLYGGRA